MPAIELTLCYRYSCELNEENGSFCGFYAHLAAFCQIPDITALSPFTHGKCCVRIFGQHSEQFQGGRFQGKFNDRSSNLQELLEKFDRQQNREKKARPRVWKLLFLEGCLGLIAGTATVLVSRHFDGSSLDIDPELRSNALIMVSGMALVLAALIDSILVNIRAYSGQVSGIVESTKLAQRAGGTGHSAGFRISFLVANVIYTVNGQKYRCRWEIPGPFSTSNKQIGHVTAVLFDPSFPSDSIVKPSQFKANVLHLLYAGSMVCIGILVYLMLRSK